MSVDRCFYCEAEGDDHSPGCPDGIYIQKSTELFGDCKSDGEVVLTSLSVNSRRLNVEHAAAVRQFECGFNDGAKLEHVRQPSDHPAYQLGLARALAEEEERRLVEEEEDQYTEWCQQR